MVDWDKRYRDASEPPFGTAPSEYLRQVLARSDVAVGSALCLADGDGRNGRWLASQGIAVTGVDLSPVATAQARIADGLAGAKTARITADLADWRPDDSQLWDMLAIVSLHCESRLREALVRSARDWLAPGGWFVLEGFSIKGAAGDGLGPRDVDKLWNLHQVLECLKGFEIIEAFDGIARLNEGPRHQGPASVVHILARSI